jgi:hypothetical protein
MFEYIEFILGAIPDAVSDYMEKLGPSVFEEVSLSEFIDGCVGLELELVWKCEEYIIFAVTQMFWAETEYEFAEAMHSLMDNN